MRRISGSDHSTSDGGEGVKARVIYAGAKSRRALLTMSGGHRSSDIFPLTASGAASAMDRLSHKSGVHITFHKCRRTFATWARSALLSSYA